jgi:TfoX/Sxy family transcriptional regulator of competence genes
MASRKETVAYVLDQMARAGEVTARAMFGEFGVYCDGKIVALICDDTCFIKPTAEGRAYAGDVEEGPPYPGAKPCLVMSADQLEDADWLAELVRITAKALPAPKPKKPKRKRKA